MTPTERAELARAVVSEWLHSSGASANSDWLYQSEEDGLVTLIDAAIAQAVQEERERCSTIAGGRTMAAIRDQYTGEVTHYERQMTQHEIINALRVAGGAQDGS